MTVRQDENSVIRSLRAELESELAVNVKLGGLYSGVGKGSPKGVESVCSIALVVVAGVVRVIGVFVIAWHTSLLETKSTRKKYRRNGKKWWLTPPTEKEDMFMNSMKKKKKERKKEKWIMR